MIDVSPLLGTQNLPGSQHQDFRVFPGTGTERWMLDVGQRRPWHLKTWPRATVRARLIYRAAWALGTLGISLPHRVETFTVTANAPYAQLSTEFDQLGIFLGTPGPNRKFVVYAAQSDRSVFVKIPQGPESSELISREAQVLEMLAHEPDLSPLVPTAHRIAGQLAIENVESHGVTHAALDLAEVARIQNLLERRSATKRPLWALRSEWECNRKNCTLSADPKTHALLGKAREAAHALLDRLPQDLEVPCYMAHGDFTRWNVLRAADGSARIIDWELFGLKPRWFDLVHYVVSYQLLVARTSAIKLVPLLRRVAQRIGVIGQEHLWWRHVGLYFAFQSLYYADVYERQVTLHPQAKTQLAAWAEILGTLYQYKTLERASR